MADLHDKAAQNPLLAVGGMPPKARFKVELICIVDTIDSGILVCRDLKGSLHLPPSRLFHWAKRYFEGHNLRAYR